MMRRRLFTISSAFSLVLCAAAVAMWAWSAWHCNLIEWANETTDHGIWRFHQIRIASQRGGISSYFGRADVIAADDRSVNDVRGYFESHPHGVELKSLPSSGEYPFAYMNVPQSLLRTIGFEAGRRKGSR